MKNINKHTLCTAAETETETDKSTDGEEKKPPLSSSDAGPRCPYIAIARQEKWLSHLSMRQVPISPSDNCLYFRVDYAQLRSRDENLQIAVWAGWKFARKSPPNLRAQAPQP
jgi:hypothetical protein